MITIEGGMSKSVHFSNLLFNITVSFEHGPRFKHTISEELIQLIV